MTQGPPRATDSRPLGHLSSPRTLLDSGLEGLMWGVYWPTGSPFPLSVTKWKLCLGAPKTKERWVPSAAYRIRIRPKKPLRAGKGFIPDHEYGICQQPRWPCRWWEQDAGLGPRGRGCSGRLHSAIIPDTGPESACSGGNPGVARHTFQSF